LERASSIQKIVPQQLPSAQGTQKAPAVMPITMTSAMIVTGEYGSRIIGVVNARELSWMA